MGVGMGSRLKREGIDAHIELILFVFAAETNPTCKAIIF